MVVVMQHVVVVLGSKKTQCQALHLSPKQMFKEEGYQNFDKMRV